MQQHPGQLVLEDLGRFGVEEVSEALPRLAIGLHHAVDELLETLLASGGAERSSEVFGGDDGRGIDTPEVRKFNAFLLEDHLAGLPVGLHHVAAFPDHLVIWMHA